VLPSITGMTGLFYTFGALALGGGFLYYALQLKFAPRPDLPMTTFRYSIWYLMALFSFLLIDHYIPALWPA
jgi:protoheme IX farnesyltransferase